MDYKGELLEFIKTLINKDSEFKSELLEMIRNSDKKGKRDKYTKPVCDNKEINNEKNSDLVAINNVLMDFKKDDLYEFLYEYRLLGDAKVNTKTTKQQMVDIAVKSTLDKYTLDKVKKLIQEYNSKECIDIFTEVMDNKEKLLTTLLDMTVKDLKKIIKKYKLLADKSISKQKDKKNIAEYIVAEAERQMKSATII